MGGCWREQAALAGSAALHPEGATISYYLLFEIGCNLILPQWPASHLLRCWIFGLQP